MRNSIFLPNAYESWMATLKYCNKILDGEISLRTKKMFVSSFQNAIELFIKQIMVNNNNKHIIPKPKEKCSQRIKEEYQIFQSTPNQQYFSVKHNISLHTITFKNIVNNLNKILSPNLIPISCNYKSLKNSLNKLRDLRNETTHSYIDEENFLLESEFQDLLNLLNIFFEIIENSDLLPFWGEPPSFVSMWLPPKKQQITSYRDLVLQSKINQQIKLLIDEFDIHTTDSYFMSFIDGAFLFFKEENDSSLSPDSFWARIIAINKYT